jgi:hypothetical protein
MAPNDQSSEVAKSKPGKGAQKKDELKGEVLEVRAWLVYTTIPCTAQPALEVEVEFTAQGGAQMMTYDCVMTLYYDVSPPFLPQIRLFGILRSKVFFYFYSIRRES